jgi:hypothetical protein
LALMQLRARSRWATEFGVVLADTVEHAAPYIREFHKQIE